MREGECIKKSATSGWEVALGGVIRDAVITTLRRLFYFCTLGVEEFVATLDEELAVD